MKKIVLLVFTFFLTVHSYGQSSKVVTYPLNLLYKKYLKECLEPYNVTLKEAESYQNTFVSTLDFVDRFKNSCDPKILEFYVRKDKPLWKIDLEVAAYYDSLSVVNGISEEKADLNRKKETTENYYSKLSRDFKKFSALEKGELKLIDYSAVNNKSKNLFNDLQQLGLNKEESEKYLLLLNKN